MSTKENTARAVTILYTNWRGETAVRRICVAGPMWHGSNAWHREPQWFVEVFDLDKREHRTLALAGLKAWGAEAVAAALIPSKPSQVQTSEPQALQDYQNSFGSFT